MRQSKTRTRLLTALVCLFLVLPALWIYHPIRHHETTNCDDYYITENAFKEKFGLNLETLVYGATVVTTGVWMPFTELFIGIEHVLFGTDYGMYRMGCLLLLPFPLLLLLQFLQKKRQTLALGRRHMVFPAKIQVGPQPFFVMGVRGFRDFPGPQIRLEICL